MSYYYYYYFKLRLHRDAETHKGVCSRSVIKMKKLKETNQPLPDFPLVRYHLERRAWRALTGL